MAVYGLDIGGTKIETAIFDHNLNVLKSWRIDTPTEDYQVFLETIGQLVAQADSYTGERGKVGIGMPGLITPKGQALSANIPCASGKYIRDDLIKILSRPVALENDTRCFALSEAISGAGKGHDRVFGAIIGTGAAGGFCRNGQLDITGQGFAGEYGHIPLPADIQAQYKLPVLKCGCGLQACVESYIAGPGISRLYKHFSGKHISPEHWVARLKQGEQHAKTVLQCHLDILGSTFASLAKFLEPDVIVLGGGVSLVDEIVENLPQAIEKYLFAGFRAPLLKRALHGDSSGVRGAALLGAEINDQ
ncbi:ROK family protein [Thalassotalea fonticola]|uniref:ROK family protein n=1 Tax=Thalassotalea fonticola TaxID=3065649 RepID=A0ABZ0GMN1_9GAMM|nr:ROK family protein [Colwelliaceae bacterium S1-1]